VQAAGAALGDALEGDDWSELIDSARGILLAQVQRRITSAAIGATLGIAGKVSAKILNARITKQTIQGTRDWYRARKAKWAGKTSGTGVKYDKNGWPDFSNHLHPGKNTVSITLTGSRGLDEQLANKAAGYAKTPTGYTWHHHQKLGTMSWTPIVRQRIG
jgi:hypothetical protein